MCDANGVAVKQRGLAGAKPDPAHDVARLVDAERTGDSRDVARGQHGSERPVTLERPASHRERDVLEVGRGDAAGQALELGVAMEHGQERSDEHRHRHALGAQVLGTEQQPRGRVGGGTQQRRLHGRVEARDAKHHGRASVSCCLDDRPWQHAIGPHDPPTSVAAEPRDRFADPAEISPRLSAAQLEHDRVVAVAFDLALAKQ